MAIDSLGRSGAPQPDPRRADAADKGAAVTPNAVATERPRAAQAAADTVELSAEALALASQEVPARTIEPIRLREITRKIADGQYEAPPTLEMLTNRLMKELRGEQ
jgi:anti-sigma28 factor (negative regulator of flagellin synthesis)